MFHRDGYVSSNEWLIDYVSNMMVPYETPYTALGHIDRGSIDEMRCNYLALPAVFRHQLDNYVQYLFLSWKWITDKFEWVQKRAAQMIKDLENTEMLREWACSDWRKDNRETRKYQHRGKTFYKWEREQLFPSVIQNWVSWAWATADKI